MLSVGMRVLWFFTAACVWQAGCGSTSMTPTGPEQTPRELNCAFQIFTAPPVEGYSEIAVIDVKAGTLEHKVFMDIADFKAEIGPYVCRAGGDAAIAYSSDGVYRKATVLKRTAKVPAASKSTEAPPRGGGGVDE